MTSITSMVRVWDTPEMEHDEVPFSLRRPRTEEECAVVRELAYSIWKTVSEGRDNFPWAYASAMEQFDVHDAEQMKEMIDECNDWDMDIKVTPAYSFDHNKSVYKFTWDNPQLE